MQKQSTKTTKVKVQVLPVGYAWGYNGSAYQEMQEFEDDVKFILHPHPSVSQREELEASGFNT